jgi:hypothetical protein
MASEQSASDGHQWTERDWEDLLDDIGDRSIIPVIGSELLTISVEGRTFPLYRVIAERLAERLRLPARSLSKQRTLNSVVCDYVKDDRSRNVPNRVYPRFCEVLHELSAPPPETLRQLAEITQFSLFVTTTPDLLMETAINEVRFNGVQGTATLAFSPRDADDLNSAYAKLQCPTVYHLFGKLSTLPEQFVLSDEDLLEFLHRLQGAENRLPNLFDALGESHLLFLGGSFTDWLARFFLRATKRFRPSRVQSHDLLAAESFATDPELVLFLRTFANKTRVQTLDPVGFVAELHRRWRQRYPAAATSAAFPYVPPPPKMPPGAIFISYASDDATAVHELKRGLDAAGLKVWFDKDQLMVGVAWDQEIKNNINRSTLFLPVISNATQRRLHNAYFREEWHTADAIARRSDARSVFVIPIAIDRISSEQAAVPETFKQRQFEYLPNGIPTPGFVERVRELAADAANRNAPNVAA